MLAQTDKTAANFLGNKFVTIYSSKLHNIPLSSGSALLNANQVSILRGALMHWVTRLFFAILGCFWAVIPNTIIASDFGGVGLIKLPTGRVAADGTLRATISRENVADIYNISYQATPWLEATFRYSIFNPRNLSYSSDIGRDRSYEAKARIFREGVWLPEVAVGVRDVLGTGIWEGEYAVASKELGRFDLSVGMGWGRLSSRNPIDNPLSTFDQAFDLRPFGKESGGKYGGESRSNSYFRGPAAWFGGVRYRWGRLPLQFLAEYNSDDYAREVRANTLHDPSPWNLGIEWQFRNGLTLGTSWLHGSSFGLRFSGSFDTKSTPKRKKGTAFYSSSEPRSVSGAPKNLDLDAWYDRILFDAERSGLRLNRAAVDEEKALVALEVENTGYALTADAVHKALSLTEVHLPRSIKTVELALREEDHLAPTIRYQRQKRVAKNFFSQNPRIGENSNYKTIESIKIGPNKRIGSESNLTAYQYPFINFGADLSSRVQLMDPDAPLAKQLYAKLSARVSIAPHFNLWGVYGQDIYNDFTTDRVSNSRIQKVRSDVNRYLTEGESGLDQLFLEYRNTLGKSVHYRTYAGVLESMYAGIGGELLFEPFAHRWALGLTLNALRQRGFEKNFELLDYSTVTGFFSLYYASPWYNLDIAIHTGRYLARDKGATFEARRTFDNGFSIGGFFTRTDLPADLFGEGSFDKGLYFRIPFNGLLPGNSKNAYATIMRPLDRDGGRRLEDFSGSLWFARRKVRYDALVNNRARMVP